MYIVLLFVFWYCHKRGREVRLERERLLTESEISALDDDAPVTTSSAPPTTTAPTGASMQEVEAGMRAAQEAEDEESRLGRLGYAESGSLAQFEKKKAQEKAGEPSPSQVAHTVRAD